MGRIVRFGQTQPCLIITLFIDKTYNVRMLKTYHGNDLAAEANAMAEGPDDTFGISLSEIDGKLVDCDDGVLCRKDGPNLAERFKQLPPLGLEDAVMAFANKREGAIIQVADGAHGLQGKTGVKFIKNYIGLWSAMPSPRTLTT